ncbi:MAG: hypothetical protein WA435_05855 [Gallionellaceae bacterium]
MSCLNRAYPGKDTTYILDFVNAPDEVLEAFKTYYTTATLAGVTDPGSGQLQEREKALLAEIIEKVNTLFEGELSDDDKLVYVNHVLKGKLLESDILVQQAGNNTKEQFSNSPDFANELMNAIMDALSAHTTMSKQALDSEKVRSGLKDVLLGPARLYESLRKRGENRWGGGAA